MCISLSFERETWSSRRISSFNLLSDKEWRKNMKRIYFAENNIVTGFEDHASAQVARDRIGDIAIELGHTKVADLFTIIPDLIQSACHHRADAGWTRLQHSISCFRPSTTTNLRRYNPQTKTKSPTNPTLFTSMSPPAIWTIPTVFCVPFLHTHRILAAEIFLLMCIKEV